MTRRPQPPSRSRYAAEHPVVALHTDKATYERLVALRTQSGLSLGQLVIQALGLVEKDIGGASAMGYARGLQEGRDQGYRQGFAEARERYRLVFPCNICKQLIEIQAGSDPAKVAVNALHGWVHSECRGRLVVRVRPPNL